MLLITFSISVECLAVVAYCALLFVRVLVVVRMCNCCCDFSLIQYWCCINSIFVFNSHAVHSVDAIAHIQRYKQANHKTFNIHGEHINF